ncbi:MAG: YdcF family protein [Anaerolineae bacterium]|nr:YdcF family protein [Anaerolineae bacterium]
MNGQANRRRTGMAMVGIVLLLVVVAVPLAALWNILRYAWVETKTPADAILVLGASVWPGERPSPILLSRIQAGVALYKQGYAPRIIVSGGLGKLPPSEAEAMRRVAIGMGVPDAAIIVEDQSHSTMANIRNSAEIMAAQGWRSVLLVSDPYHMFRACRTAADAGLDVRPVPVADSPGWTNLRLRAYYTIREAFAVVAYEILRVGRWIVDRLF